VLTNRFLWLAGALICLLLAVFRLNPLVGWAETHNRDVALSGAGVYLSLRAINAALSVAQEVEVGGSVVVSASVRPLAVLDPVDDTVERISAVVFTVATVSAVLAVGLGPLSALGLFLLAFGLGARAINAPGLARWSQRTIPVGVFLAVICPAIFGLGSVAGEFATRGTWDAAMSELQAIAQTAGAVSGVPIEAAAGPPPDFLTGVRETITGVADATSYFLENAEDIFDAGLTIIAIFLLRLIVLPMVLLWLAWRMMEGQMSRLMSAP
jgi:hypothetical protein